MEGEQREKKIQKNIQNKSKHKNNKYFSWVTAVRVLSLAGSHSPPHLPRMPSNPVLISGPAVGAAQILIWSYSCVFLPPMSTAIRTSVFSLLGALNVRLKVKASSRNVETQVWSLGGKIPWRRKWQPTLVLLPRKFHGWRSLVGYSPWGHKEPEQLSDFTSLHFNVLLYIP